MKREGRIKDMDVLGKKLSEKTESICKGIIDELVYPVKFLKLDPENE